MLQGFCSASCKMFFCRGIPDLYLLATHSTSLCLQVVKTKTVSLNCQMFSEGQSHPWLKTTEPGLGLEHILPISVSAYDSDSQHTSLEHKPSLSSLKSISRFHSQISLLPGPPFIQVFIYYSSL